MVQVGFSTGKDSAVSEIIRKVTGCPYSHAFFIYDSADYGCKFVSEEDHGGVQNQPLDLFLRTNTLVEVWTPREAGAIDAALKASVQLYGYGYDYSGLVGEGLLSIRAKLERSRVLAGAPNPLHSAQTLFCSAYVSAVLELIRLDGFPVDWAPGVKPEDLHGFLDPLGTFAPPTPASM